MASRTKNSKPGRSRGEGSPRGKALSSSPAGQAGSPKRAGQSKKVAPELGKPDLAASLPHAGEALTIASEVSPTALTAATQAAEGAVPTVEAHLPTANAAKPVDGAVTAPLSTARPGADSAAASSPLEEPGSAAETDARRPIPAPEPSRPRLVSLPGTQTTSASSASRGSAPEWPGLGGAEGVFGHAAARSAAIATLGLLDLNTRVLELMRQQSEVSLSAIGAVLTARSIGDAMRAQTDGMSRTLDLHSTQWNEIARTFRRVVEDSAEPVRAASGWPAS